MIGYVEIYSQANTNHDSAIDIIKFIDIYYGANDAW